MRNLLWRGLAIALAGIVSWLLWTWPEEPAPVEFSLAPNCKEPIFITDKKEWVCIEGQRAPSNPP